MSQLCNWSSIYKIQYTVYIVTPCKPNLQSRNENFMTLYMMNNTITDYEVTSVRISHTCWQILVYFSSGNVTTAVLIKVTDHAELCCGTVVYTVEHQRVTNETPIWYGKLFMHGVVLWLSKWKLLSSTFLQFCLLCYASLFYIFNLTMKFCDLNAVSRSKLISELSLYFDCNIVLVQCCFHVKISINQIPEYFVKESYLNHKCWVNNFVYKFREVPEKHLENIHTDKTILIRPKCILLISLLHQWNNFH